MTTEITISKKNRELGFGIAFKKNLQMAIPIVSARVTSAISGFITMLMIAKLGHAELAAGALINSIMLSFLVPMWSLFFSVGILIGHAHGAKQEAEIGKIMHQALILGLIVGIPIMVLLWNITPILTLLGQDPHLSYITQDFYNGYTWSVIPGICYVVALQFLSAISKQKLNLLFTVLAVILIIIFGYAAVFGKFGIPKFGVKGMGYATALTFLVIDLLMFSYFFFNQTYLQYEIFKFEKKLHFHYLSKLFSLGWPISLMAAGELIIFSLSTIFVGWLGEQPLAAQQITLQINMIAFMFPMGIAQACTILVSQELGRKNFAIIRKLGYAAIMLSLLATIVFAICYLLFPKPLIGLYLNTGNPVNLPTLSLSVTLIAITGLMNIFDGIRTVAACALRGMRDTIQPMLIFVVLGCILTLPFSYILGFPLHYGVAGIRFGFVIGFFFGAVILLHRFHKFSSPTNLQAKTLKHKISATL